MAHAPQHELLPAGGAYGYLLAAAVVVGAGYWHRRTRREPRMFFIFIGMLAGAFAGAKIAYLIAEGWVDWPMPDRWLRFATGKSILGGLLGGYAGTEIAKRLVGFSEPTGDIFVMVLPVGLLMGRMGCALHGCCQGASLSLFGSDFRWPAPLAEAVFQMAMLGALIATRHNRSWDHRRFFLYLICYGSFRFLHEFVRATPRFAGNFSGYQILAASMVAVGWMAYFRRGAVTTCSQPQIKCER